MRSTWMLNAALFAVIAVAVGGCLRRSEEAELRAVDTGVTDRGATDLGATDSGATDSGAIDLGATDGGADMTDATVEPDVGPLICEFVVSNPKIVFSEQDDAPDLASQGSHLLIWSPERAAFMALTIDNREVDRPRWIELRTADGAPINSVVGVVSPMCQVEACAAGERCHVQSVIRRASTDDFLVVLGRYGADSRTQVLTVPNTLAAVDCATPTCALSPLGDGFDGGHRERVSHPLPHPDGSLSIMWEPQGNLGSYLARCTDEQTVFDTASGRAFANTEVTQRQALAARDPRLLIAAYNNSGIEDLVRVLTLTEVEPSAVTSVGTIEPAVLEGLVPNGIEIALARDDRLWMLASQWDSQAETHRIRVLQSAPIGADNTLEPREWQLRSAKNNAINDAQMLMTNGGPALGWFDATQRKLIFSWFDFEAEARAHAEANVDAECVPTSIEMAWNGLDGADARFGVLWACGAQGASEVLWYQEVRCVPDE